MDKVKSCNFPELSQEFTELFNDAEKTLIIVGVIGKSNLPNCNKMLCFDLFSCHSIFLQEEGPERVENRIKFYYEKGSNHIFVHFETAYDHYIASDLIKKADFDYFLPFNTQMRTRFARMIFFATQICHIVVLVETSSEFDASYLSIFKSLKIIREKYVLKFLPKLLKNTSISGAIAREYRLCSPRFIFLFEKISRPVDNLISYEIEKEEQIYQMLRSNFIITNNSNLSLFSVPKNKNKKFLYINTNDKVHSDPVVDSVEFLLQYINATPETEEDLYSIRPYRGYATNYFQDTKTKDYEEKQKSFLKLLNEHVEEAMSTGFDDSIAKYRGKTHFVRPGMKMWYEIFKFMHKIFIENANNPDFEANDPDYKAYLDNFYKILDIDQQFFYDSCTHGYDLALLNYSELLPHHYSKSYHESKLASALEIFHKYARGPESESLEDKLRDTCEAIWLNGKQQCEILSLRGNPCILLTKHATNEGTNHSSGVVYISTCNCGKTQGRREDPYTLKKANYEFYQIMQQSCSVCEKASIIDFPIFIPSSSEYKAAQVSNKKIMNLILSEFSNKTPNEEEKNSDQHHLSASQKTQESESDLSIGSISDDELGRKDKKKHADDSDDEMNEIIVKIGEIDVKEKQTEASTTEYLPGMILANSPQGLLPQFPSWSLMCIGASSLYSHNTGLTESQQPGFLSGSQFLLAWDVKVRLEHAQTWAENYEKNRSRKKQKQLTTQNSSGTFFTLKIFVGMEYECFARHRFTMDSNHTVLRGAGGGGSKACGSKVVLTNMPLYFPCPCRQIGQLMRIHVVTPKAPVNITIDPKIKIRRETESIFVTGWTEPVKLTQSAYWVLRLPYVYQAEGDPIPVPENVPSSVEALRYGFLMEGMFGIKEDESGVMP
ncbi:nonsense-mediated mRNA decay factor SMG8 [Chironomus tepperi]|uniref:nonsense-mediated mRNA decay factor SMG8 n=1 Tax=Chironomus tepperi TaxID=113505 RepID=UPI00391F206E